MNSFLKQNGLYDLIMEKQPPVDLDKIDLEIMKLLSKDCRKSYREINRDLEDTVKSPITVKNHIDHLMEKDVIKGYTIDINYQRLGYDIIAFIDLTISKGKMLEVEKEIAAHPNVYGVYDLTGEYDAVILARFKTRSELSDLVKMINSNQYVVRTNTHLVLNVIKEGMKFPELVDHEQSKES